MDDALLSRFEALIASRTGLMTRPRDKNGLRVALAARTAALRFHKPESYIALLTAEGSESEREWSWLTAVLTNNESYFFRDKGQMALLREQIVPEIIARNRPGRTLRIWSAGCATGEEPYSIAMMLAELLPGYGAGWQISVYGTDIDEKALQKARAGLYQAWSFRAMGELETAQYMPFFRKLKTGFQLDEKIRNMVTLAQGNLAGDKFPDEATGLYDMDLILCRNVFIYFDPAAKSSVLGKFAATLKEGGCLMAGHSEIHGQPLESLRVRVFPASVIYERTPKAGPAEYLHVPQALIPAVDRLVGVNDTPVVFKPVAKREPTSESEDLLAARGDANTGNYEAAIKSCERLIEENPFEAGPYQLLASIAEEQGLYDKSKVLLKKALYLEPRAPAIYLALGELYTREGDTARARKMHGTALELLELMPDATQMASNEGQTSRQWIAHLTQLLAQGK